MQISQSTRESIASIRLDDGHIIRRSAEVEREREAALHDLLQASEFQPICIPPSGPYDVTISTRDNRLRFIIGSPQLPEPREVVLSLSPYRGIIKDYFLICESYYNALSQEPHRIEAIDMARRGLHNEGSDLLREQLATRIKLDFDTARRLFTLICVLHIK